MERAHRADKGVFPPHSLPQPAANRPPPAMAPRLVRALAPPALVALVLAPGPVMYAMHVAAARVAAAVAAVAASASPLALVAAALATLAAVAHAASAPAVEEARRLRASLAEHSETLAGIDRGLAVRGREGGGKGGGNIRRVLEKRKSTTPHHHHHHLPPNQQILYSHVDNVAVLQLETSRRAAALQAELDAALAALLGDDGIADLKAAAADGAAAARRARLADADVGACLAGVRRAYVWAVGAAFWWASVGAPPTGGEATPTRPPFTAQLALPPPKDWAPQPTAAAYVVGEATAATTAAAAAAGAPAAAPPSLLAALLPFLRRRRRA